MTYKKVVNFMVFVISILLVNYVTTQISDFLLSYRYRYNPLKVTLIGMCTMVFVLYPAYNYLDDFSEKTARKLFSAGKNAGGKFIGVIWAFLVAFGVLFLCYLHMWFGITLLDLF